MAPPGPILPDPAEGVPPTGAQRLWKRIAVWMRPPRRLRFTIEGWVFLLMVAAVAGAAMNTGNNLLYMLCSIMLAMIAVSGVLSESALRRVQLQRNLPPAIFANRVANGRLLARNPRRLLPNVALSVLDRPGRRADAETLAVTVPWVPPGGEDVSLPAEYLFRRRGLHRLAGFEVSTRYPFGLFRKSYQVARPLDVLVFPDVSAGGTVDRSHGSSQGIREGRDKGLDGDYVGLRDFSPGEDARLIHWKTSARRGDLVAVERSRSDGATATVYLLPSTDAGDPDAHAAAFERAVSRAAGTLVRLSREGDEVGLVTPAERFAPGRGEAHLRSLLTHLALIPTQPGPLHPDLRALRARLGNSNVVVAR